jgi:hypothetical protein
MLRRRRSSSKPLTAALASVLTVVTLVGVGHTETYKDIGYVDSLGDLKKKFPNATFTNWSPGWAQDTDAMYSIVGRGMSGPIIVKFTGSRWFEPSPGSRFSEMVAPGPRPALSTSHAAAETASRSKSWR